MADMTDEQIRRLKRGGHDPVKVYAAYKAAVETEARPTVILAHTVKGYGLGEAGEGRNITHQQKKLNEEELREFRDRFDIPISDKDVAEAPFYRPPDDSPEMRYLQERRRALGGYVPSRRSPTAKLKPPKWEDYAEFFAGSEGREVSTTMAFVRLLVRLHARQVGGPVHRADRARRSPHLRHGGPLPPVRHLRPQRPALRAGRFRHRALLQARPRTGRSSRKGSPRPAPMSSFIAAGTAHSSHGLNMIPFFIYYSMFGFQRIGDLMWAAGDMRCRGFVLGGTAGRTTLAGEGPPAPGRQHPRSSPWPIPTARPTIPASPTRWP